MTVVGDQAWDQPGGVLLIEYGGITVLAQKAAAEEALVCLRDMRPRLRERVLAGVESYMIKTVLRALLGLTDCREIIEYSANVVLWYAGEVLADRATLEEAELRAALLRGKGGACAGGK